MLLGSHSGGPGEGDKGSGGEDGGPGEGVWGPGEGEYIQPVEEDHPDWEDGGSSLSPDILLQSNLLGPPTKLQDSSLDSSGSCSGVWGNG